MKNDHPLIQALMARTSKRRRLCVHEPASETSATPAGIASRPPPAGRRPKRLGQQAKFDGSISCYNRDRPHQALGMKYPAELYRPSPRVYRGLSELDYPFHDRTVTHRGICLGKRKINLSTVFAGQNVGVKEVSDKIWLVTFMHYDLGFFDHETRRLEPVDNPFEPKVLPMSPV